MTNLHILLCMSRPIYAYHMEITCLCLDSVGADRTSRLAADKWRHMMWKAKMFDMACTSQAALTLSKCIQPWNNFLFWIMDWLVDKSCGRWSFGCLLLLIFDPFENAIHLYCCYGVNIPAVETSNLCLTRIWLLLNHAESMEKRLLMDHLCSLEVEMDQYQK